MGFTTVDGRNPAPIHMVHIPLFAGFHTCWVVQDFFHQQYVPCFYDPTTLLEAIFIFVGPIHLGPEFHQVFGGWQWKNVVPKREATSTVMIC